MKIICTHDIGSTTLYRQLMLNATDCLGCCLFNENLHANSFHEPIIRPDFIWNQCHRILTLRLSRRETHRGNSINTVTLRTRKILITAVLQVSGTAQLSSFQHRLPEDTK